MQEIILEEELNVEVVFDDSLVLDSSLGGCCCSCCSSCCCSAAVCEHTDESENI
jgi:hypothetical protein